MKRSANIVVVVVVVAVSAAAGCPAPKDACVGDAEVCAAFDVGAGANDAKLLTCDGQPSAVVVASTDGRVDTFALPGGALTHSVRLPDGANAFAIAVDDADGVAVVTENGSDGLALIDPCHDEVIAQAQVQGGARPQPVVFDGERTFWVGFTNIVVLGNPSTLDPGVVASFTLNDDKRGLTPGPAVTLPCKNPQGLALDGDDIWAACTGTLGVDGAGNAAALDDGALVQMHVDAASGAVAIDHTIVAGRAAPGTPGVFAGRSRIVAGSVVTSDLLWASLADPVDDALADPVDVDGPAVDSLFRAARWDDHTALLPQFDRDGIVVANIPEAPGPPSLGRFILVGEGGTTLRGLVTIDVRPGFDGEDGVDGVALLTLSSQAVPLRLAKVLGAPEAP